MADDVLVSSVLAQTEYETEDKLLVTGTLAQTEYDPEIGKMHLSSIFAQVEYDYYLYSSQKTQGIHGSILEVNNKTIRPISLCGSVLLVNNNNKTQCLNGLVELGVYIMPSSLKFEIWNVEKTEKLNELNGTLNLDDATSGSIDFVVKNVNGIETECNLKISKAGLLNDNFVTDNITLSADNGITKVKELTIAAIPEDDFSDTITLFYECNNPGSYLLGSHNYRVKLFGRDLWQDYTNSAYWSSASETTQSPEQSFDTFWSSGYDTILEENVLWLAPSGDWGTDFQPDKVKITYTPAASGDSLIVNLYNITEGATTTIVNHSSYISESELTLTWDTRLDFNRMKLMTENNNSFEVDLISFYHDEDPTEGININWTEICNFGYADVQWTLDGYVGYGDGEFYSKEIDGQNYLSFWFPTLNLVENEQIKVRVTFSNASTIDFEFCDGSQWNETNKTYESISSIEGTQISSVISEAIYTITPTESSSGMVGIRLNNESSSFVVENIEIDKNIDTAYISDALIAEDSYDIVFPGNGSAVWSSYKWVLSDVENQFFLRNITYGIPYSSVYRIITESDIEFTKIGLRTYGNEYDNDWWTPLTYQKMYDGNGQYIYTIRTYLGNTFDTINFEFDSESLDMEIICIHYLQFSGPPPPQ